MSLYSPNKTPVLPPQRMLLFLQTMPPNNIVLWKHITLRRRLDKGIRYWISTWQPSIYPDETYVRRNPRQSLACFVSFEFLPKMKKWISIHSTEYLSRVIFNSHICYFCFALLCLFFCLFFVYFSIFLLYVIVLMFYFLLFIYHISLLTWVLCFIPLCVVNVF